MNEDEKAYKLELEEKKRVADEEEARHKELERRSAEIWFSKKDGHIKKLLESLGWPKTIMSTEITTPDGVDRREFKAAMPHVMKRLGYKIVASPNSKDGRWYIKGGKHAAMYAKVAGRSKV